jgi:hypothetical protein
MKHIMEICPMCQRKILEHDMTHHHYIPKNEGGCLDDTMRICKTCHRTIHFCIPLHKIKLYKTVEEVLQHPKIQIYIQWIRLKNNHSHYSPKKIYKLLKTA